MHGKFESADKEVLVPCFNVLFRQSHFEVTGQVHPKHKLQVSPFQRIFSAGKL
jgi:hypothetical protein